MGMFTAGASEMLQRYVYPPLSAVWGGLLNLTGRRRRAAHRADADEKKSQTRRNKARWNAAHDR